MIEFTLSYGATAAVFVVFLILGVGLAFGIYGAGYTVGIKQRDANAEAVRQDLEATIQSMRGDIDRLYAQSRGGPNTASSDHARYKKESLDELAKIVAIRH
jgi:hypothetical protein